MVGHALVLNATFEPLNIVPWQRAVQLIFQGKVEVIEESDRTIRTVRTVFRMPLVLRLVQFVPLSRKKNVIRFSRTNVFLRDRNTCQYCGRFYHRTQLTLDHVTPIVQGGKRTWENIVTACKPCNQKKGGRTPQQARMYLIQKPKCPQWLATSVLHHSGVWFPESWQPYLSKTKEPILLAVEELSDLDSLFSSP